MRILVVTQYFWPENFRINDLVTELVTRGHEVTVLTGLPNYPEGVIHADFAKKPEDFSSFAGARIVRVPILPRGKGSFRLVLNYLSFVISGLVLGGWRLRHANVDAIFVFQTSPITVAIPALWFRWRKRAPLLMWVLDLWPESISAVGAVTSPLVLRWVGRLVAFIYRRCDRILVQSKAFIPNILKYSGTTDQVHYFPNWAEPIFHGPLSEVEVAPELAPYANTFNVLFAGNIGEAQDFPAILDAAEALKDRTDIRFLILGDGRAADWVRSEVQRRNLEKTFILLGRHPLDRMPAFFRGAQALLVSLRKDPIFAMTIPGKVQSYLASGIPILAMLDGDGARIIREAQAGLVASAGVGSELADLIRKFMAMSASARLEMGRRGQNYYEREFERGNLITSLELWMSTLCRPSFELLP